MVALGSDGAPVMIGKRSGVAQRSQETIPHLISNNSVAHCLAMASAQRS